MGDDIIEQSTKDVGLKIEIGQNIEQRLQEASKKQQSVWYRRSRISYEKESAKVWFYWRNVTSKGIGGIER